MARLRALEDHELGPEMFESYFRFYYPSHHPNSAGHLR